MQKEHSISLPLRRYIVSVCSSVLFYIIALIVSLIWLQNDPPLPWRYFIAVLPVLPALWLPVAVTQFVRQMDELQKLIVLESLAFAFVATAALTFTYGFLQNAGLPTVDWTWVWPLMATCWMVGTVLSWRRYR